MKKLRKYLIAGLLITLPLVLSAYLLVALFRFMDNILGRYLADYLRQEIGFYVPGMGLILSVILIILVGFFATHFLGRHIKADLEGLLLRIPLLKNIYPPIKEIVRFFVSEEKRVKFNRVVLAPYPNKDSWSVGFVTNEGWEEANRKTGEELVSVFIPFVPSPLSGLYALLPKAALIPLDVSPEDALKLIVSAGLLAPQAKSNK